MAALDLACRQTSGASCGQPRLRALESIRAREPMLRDYAPPPLRRLSRFASSSPPSPILTLKVSHDLRQSGKTAAKPILPLVDMGAQNPQSLRRWPCQGLRLAGKRFLASRASCPRKRVAQQAELSQSTLCDRIMR